MHLGPARALLRMPRLDRHGTRLSRDCLNGARLLRRAGLLWRKWTHWLRLLRLIHDDLPNVLNGVAPSDRPND